MSSQVPPANTQELAEDPKAICVYCASSPGVQPEYREAAISLGQALARSERTLIYGGGNKGLMGVISSTVTSSPGGKAIGILPRAMVLAGGEGRGKTELRTEAVNSETMRTVVVETMHERKTLMARLAGGGFIGLPGGFGTFEEVLEAITWSQLGIHQKPVVLVNVNGFWDPLRALIDNAMEEVFIQPKNRDLVTFVGPPDGKMNGFDWGAATIQALESWTPPTEGGLFVWKEDKLSSI